MFVEQLPTKVHVNMYLRAFSKIDDYNMVSESVADEDDKNVLHSTDQK